MRILASSRSLHQPEGPFSVGLGIFDGVHLGHQALLRRVRETAEADAIESLVYTFDPHPEQVVRPLHAPKLLEPLAVRLEGFSNLGISAALIERFTTEFAHTPAESFVSNVLVRLLQVRHVVVGRDFSFGAGGRGDAKLLEECGRHHDFQVHVIEPVMLDGVKVSSSRIRDLVQTGDLRKAADLLGRPFALSGLVMRGGRRGRTLGFATANIRAENEVIPATGVYVAEAAGAIGSYPAVVNIGYTPTFGSSELKTEAHLLGFDGRELYGHTLQIKLIEKLRDEQRFANAEALKAQISRDIARARQTLGLDV